MSGNDRNVRWTGRVAGRLFPRRTVLQALADWPLSARIREPAHADAPHASPPVGFRPGAPSVSLPPEAFNAARVREAVDGLTGSGGVLQLPAGTAEFNEPLRLPEGVELKGFPGATRLVFRGAAFGVDICGTRDRALRGAGLCGVDIEHVDPPDGFAAAVRVTHAVSVTFESVRLPQPAAVGWFLCDGSRDVRFTDCVVDGARFDGFLFLREVTDVALYRTRAESCMQNGVLLADWRIGDGVDPEDYDAQARESGASPAFGPADRGPTRVLFSDCRISGNRRIGLCTDGAGLVTVKGCVLADNECEGITLDNGAWRSRIVASRISGNGRRGRQRDEELNIDFVQDDGLLPDGTSPVKLPGVSMDNAALCRVESCTVEGNFGEGVKFVRAAYGCSVLHNCILHNNRGGSTGHPHYGLRLGSDPRQHADQHDFASSFNLVQGNDIIGAHSAAIMLSRGTVGNVILNNRFDGAGPRPVRGALHANTVLDNACGNDPAHGY